MVVMQIALSRIRVPQKKAQILKRIRLLDLLHQNIHRKMTFVCASAGFGKTTLLVDFANDVDAKICWYQISAAEADFPTFFRYFISAIQQEYPELGKDLLNLVNEPKRINPRAVALEFTNEALEEIKDYTLLVLDDYHLISQNYEIVSFIETVLENLPDQVRLLIGSRSVYGIPSAELYVREELSLISADDLRFTTSELIDLSRQHFQVKLTKSKAQQIIENTDGWIIAILLALRGEHPAAIIPKLADAKEQIHKYLKEEILDNVEPELKRFMLVSSLFNEFSIDQCNYVLEIENSDSIIKQLEDQNLFISRSETNQGIYYQYHQLFKEFLMIDLHKEVSLQEVNRLHLRSAEFFTRNHFENLAIDHFLLAGRKEEAARIMDEISLAYYSSGQQSVLKEWYSQISNQQNTVNLAPRLVMHIAKILINQGELNDGLELLNNVETVLREEKDYQNLVNLLATTGMVYRFTGEYQKSLTLADEVTQLVEEKHLEKYYALRAMRVKGLAYHFLNQPQSAKKHLSLAVDGMRSLNNKEPSDNLLYELVLTLADMGLISIRNGDIFQAQKSFGEALAISKEQRGHQGNVSMTANNQAYLYYLMGDYAQAWKYLEQALEAGLSVGWRRIIVDTLNNRGDLLRDIGEIDRAEKEYNRALEYKNEAQEDIAFGDTHIGLAELERVRGNFNQALFHIREAAHWNADNIEEPKYQLVTGHIYFSMGHHDLAASKLDDAYTKYAAENYPSNHRALLHLLLAMLDLNENKNDEAEEHINQALSDVAQLGYDAFFIIQCREYLPIMKEMQARLKNKQLKNILERAETFSVKFENLFTVMDEVVPDPLPVIQILGFGRGDVRIDGDILPASSWKSIGARALFYYIVDKGKVTKDEISLEFWPEFTQGKVNSNFHATLWRVRNALGHKDVIAFDGNHYRLNPDLNYYYDVQEFEDSIKKFNKANDSITEKRDWGYQAIALYKDDFLLDVDMDWSSERRYQLQRDMIQTLAELAEIEFKEGHFENARELFSRVITLDNYQDDFHIGYIKSLIALGERLTARTHLDAYKKTLRDELGIDSTEEMDKLLDRI